MALAVLAGLVTLTSPVVAQVTASAEDPRWTVEAVRDSFALVHAPLNAAVADGTERDEELVRALLRRVVGQLLASGVPRAQADAVNGGLDVANRLKTRQAALREISELAYGADLHQSADTDVTPLLFAFGNLEKALGDAQAAQMWFDSTMSHRHGAHTPLAVAAAAKLGGGIDMEAGDYAAALPKLRLAKSVLDTTVADAFERFHLDGVLAAAIVDAGGDLDEAQRLSAAAYDGMETDSIARTWTYAYLVYLDRAKVLVAAGRGPEGLRVMREGLALVRHRGDEPSEAFIHLKLAELQLSIDAPAGAEASALEALAAFEALGHTSHLAEAHGYLAAIYERDAATLPKAVHHLRECHRLQLARSTAARAEGLLALQNDHRREQAEQKALLAEQATAAAELERSSVKAQRTSLLAGLLLIGGLLAFVVHRLRERRRHGAELAALVDERTAELAARTAELEQRTRRLQASNQELERFAFIASHDLKTPLRNVTSFLGLIDRRMPDTARPVLGEYVELAKGYAKKMHALVTDVLEFSRLNDDVAGLCEVVDLRALCLEVAAARGSGEGDVSVAVLGAASAYLPPVFVRQIVGNLIDNGLKYNESSVRRVTVELAADGDGVQVRVRDNGIGIAEEYHGYVFELFKRLHTEDVYTGTGLGLASCAKIVERMGGRIELESAPGQGSTFTVTLPSYGEAGALYGAGVEPAPASEALAAAS